MYAIKFRYFVTYQVQGLESISNDTETSERESPVGPLLKRQ